MEHQDERGITYRRRDGLPKDPPSQLGAWKGSRGRSHEATLIGVPRAVLNGRDRHVMSPWASSLDDEVDINACSASSTIHPHGARVMPLSPCGSVTRRASEACMTCITREQYDARIEGAHCLHTHSVIHGPLRLSATFSWRSSNRRPSATMPRAHATCLITGSYAFDRRSGGNNGCSWRQIRHGCCATCVQRSARFRFRG